MTARRARRAHHGARVTVVGIAVIVAALLTSCTSGSSTQSQRPLPTGPYSSRPNIVFVLTDDLSNNLVQYMPHVIALERAGMRFSNYTVADSLCCPSRASILTGRFPHNTKVFTNGPPDGGFSVFNQRGENSQTFAVPLHKAGYRTAFMGKYLNGLRIPTAQRPTNTQDEHYVPPGWSTWVGAGYAYDEYDYDLNINGVDHHYGHDSDDYLTDVIGGLGKKFITDSARARKPFFLETSTFAPHSPATPAPRDVGSFKLHVPEGPSFGRKPMHAPQWLASLPPLTAERIAALSKHFNLRVESSQAVDRMIGGLENTLRAAGQLSNTEFVFSSDNGYHLGEHGMTGGKLTAFDTDIRVPLVVVGPHVAPGSVNADFVENTDLAPTFERLAGATVPSTVDGRSFEPLLHGEHPAWRTLATVEHHGPVFGPMDPDHQTHLQGNPPSYDAMRSPGFTYVRYIDGEREYYDRRTDPYEMNNIAGTLSAQRVAALDRTLDKLVTCRGQAQCWSAAEPATG